MKRTILLIIIFIIGLILIKCTSNEQPVKNGGTQVKNYATKILNEQEENIELISIKEIITTKSSYGDEIKKLTKGERVIFLVGDVEGEVNNGGFSQYMFNSSGRYAKEAVDALSLIGAKYTASLLAEAIEIYKNGVTNDNRNNPESDLSEEQENKLNELDDKFYEYKDNLYTLQIDYIKANIKDF